MDIPVSLLLYLPALIAAYMANRVYRRFFLLYKDRFGPEGVERMDPQTVEDWEARYASRPWRWLQDAPMLALEMWRLASKRQDDPELEAVRRVGERWAFASVGLAIAGVVAATVVVSLR